jgi:lipoyl-dependent peroxiredoxin
MPKRSAEAEWKGDLKGGQGSIKTKAGAQPYSFSSRFESGGGTNPEELLGAAHAGCFSMALAHELAQAGFKPNRIHTKADVHIEKSGEGFGITRIHLETEGDVPGIDQEKFQAFGEHAKENCPLSKALASVKNISLQTRLLKTVAV